MKKIGLSKQMPPSEARPLGTKRPPARKHLAHKKSSGARAAIEAMVDASPTPFEVAQAELYKTTAPWISDGPTPPAVIEDIVAMIDAVHRDRGLLPSRETFEELDARVKQEMHEEHIEHAPIVVDTAIEPVVDFSHQPAIPPATVSRSSRMTLVYVKTSKNGKRAIYSGAALSLAFPLALFVDKTAPATITDLSAFAEKVAKTPKAQMTAEEKAAAKLARKNAPKKTLAEKIAARERLLEKDRAKLAAQSASM